MLCFIWFLNRFDEYDAYCRHDAIHQSDISKPVAGAATSVAHNTSRLPSKRSRPLGSMVKRVNACWPTSHSFSNADLRRRIFRT